jgi:hypothetical protein
MGVQNPNSTNYEHPDEPNLLNLHKAMEYNTLGEPQIRVKTNLYENSTTSKLRLKISDYETVFFNTFQYGKETDIWDEYTANGASSTFMPNLSAVQMTVTGQVGSEIIRQTRNAQRYIPGRESELSFAVNFGNHTAGIRQRIGLFDERDGFFFEHGVDDVLYFVIRSSVTGSPVETRVAQSLWNGDRLDGTGVSGITLDLTKQQLMVITYEWYGAGDVELSFVINGVRTICHTFRNSNLLASVWCTTPFLPIRLEFTNVTGVAGTHTFNQGSNSLITEGTAGKLGIAQNISTPITGRTAGSANTFIPALSIRLKSTGLKGIVLPAFFQAATLDNTNVHYRLVRNATLTGASWTDMPDANSFTQYDVSATALSGGTDLDSGFVSSGAQGLKITLDQNTVYQIGRGSMGTVSDTLTLAIATTIGNKNVVGSMTWIEQR